ncbi:hypothetical protein V6N12_064656 [Hibiscus sabdariffa]|uniref:Uncharacterized protein n=1 Tax=Hibiscus sabdariffa TaxID=183260 RepID=A0ABR2G6E8_9ROSI
MVEDEDDKRIGKLGFMAVKLKEEKGKLKNCISKLGIARVKEKNGDCVVLINEELKWKAIGLHARLDQPSSPKIRNEANIICKGPKTLE